MSFMATHLRGNVARNKTIPSALSRNDFCWKQTCPTQHWVCNNLSKTSQDFFSFKLTPLYGTFKTRILQCQTKSLKRNFKNWNKLSTVCMLIVCELLSTLSYKLHNSAWELKHVFISFLVCVCACICACMCVCVHVCDGEQRTCDQHEYEFFL